MKKNIRIFFGGLFLVLVGICFGTYPLWQSKMDFIKLQDKVSIVNQLFSSKKDLAEVKSAVQKKVVHSRQKNVEDSVNSYLTDLIDVYQEVEGIYTSSDYLLMFQEKYFTHEILILQKNKELLQSNNDLIQKNIDVLKELSTKQKQNSYAKESYLKSYRDVMNKMNLKVYQKYINKMESFLVDIDKEIHIIQFLLDHFEEWNVSNGVEFQKRNVYSFYQNLEQTTHSKTLSYHLIEDKDGPIIDASDVTIYLNQTVSLDEKIKCVDTVDGEVSCSIEGNYNNGVIGDYSISIHATDQSGNSSSKFITVHVIKRVSDKPYSIDVIRNQNVVVVYGLDGNGEYTQVVQVFVCSTGRNNATPTGTFYTTRGSTWGALYGGVWGQYTTRIVGDILFHSVPYFSKNKGDLEWEEYNKLGTQASLGCVRLSVRDVKWIYYNCPAGTKVHIYDGELPQGVSKPGSIYLDGSDPNHGWDPTDDDSSNPWNY